MQTISIIDSQPVLLHPGLVERYANQIGEDMATETEREILDALCEVKEAINGTYTNDGILTRLKLQEEKTSDRAILWRQIKAGAILAVISAVIAFAAARITFQQTPTLNNTEQRIQKLEEKEAQLKQKEEELRAKEEALRLSESQQKEEELRAKEEELRLSESQRPITPRRQTNRPRPVPRGPTSFYRNQDVIATPVLRAYSSARIQSVDGRF